MGSTPSLQLLYLISVPNKRVTDETQLSVLDFRFQLYILHSSQEEHIFRGCGKRVVSLDRYCLIGLLGRGCQTESVALKRLSSTV